MNKDGEIIVVPMMFDIDTFKLLNESAIKHGLTVGAFVSEAIREKIDKTKKECSEDTKVERIKKK